MEAIRDLPRVCKHLHLPVQSGSSRVLAAMRRRHTREQYLDLVDRLRGAIPDLALSTDMIVGFPGETAADFEATLSLVERVRFQGIFSFKYSVRPNTLASKTAGRRRAGAGEDAADRGAAGARRSASSSRCTRPWWGARSTVLVDAPSRRRDWELQGRTTGNTVVNFPGPADWVGRLVPVRVTEAWPNAVRGEATGA